MSPAACFLSSPLALSPDSAKNIRLAKKILSEVMAYRRSAGGAACRDPLCADCIDPHFGKVLKAIDGNRPVVFVLPAFPGKSPNFAKVLGPLPDLAERKALEFLHELCVQIRGIYAPGAQVILCSDGRVFSDIVGMEEANVTAYQNEISRLILGLNLNSLSTFNLDDGFGTESFGEMRDILMKRFGSSLEGLQNKVRGAEKNPFDREANDALRMYRGITRFLVEDALRPGETRSRTAIQKDARQRAYEVILRSNAWSSLIEAQFPEAVRLSIHPQACGAKKLGIRLLEAESWMTPWHGVAMEVGSQVRLVKRAEAEALGAELVVVEGRPSHFRLGEAN